MRIVLEVEGGEVTFTVRQTGQTTASMQEEYPAQARSGRVVDAGPAPKKIALRPGAGASRSQRAAGGGGSNTPSSGSRSQVGMKAAIDAGPAPRQPSARAQAGRPSNQAGESFHLMGGAGQDAGSAPTLRSHRRVTHSNGGKSK